MSEKKSPFDVLNLQQNEYIPNIATSCVILGFHGSTLKTLLVKLKGDNKWVVPSSFIRKDEDPDETAHRVLKEKTRLDNAYLKQFRFFGKRDRIKFGASKEVLKLLNINPSETEWDLNRFISLCYYSLIKSEEAILTPHEYEIVEWFDVNEMPHLYSDHEEILQEALSTIRKEIGFIPIGYELLPEKFTMPELRCIYEAVLGRELDRRNFQRKMLSIGYIKPLNETRRMGAHKSPNLYSFIKEKYEDVKRYGVQIMSNNL